MKFSSLLFLSAATHLVPTALAQPKQASRDLWSRQADQGASQIETDIFAIDAAVRNFTSILTAYTGGIREAAPVTTSILNIHAVNRQAFADAQTSPSLTGVQSQRVADAVVNSVGKSIPAAIALTKAKKPLFDQAQLSSLVEASLGLLQYDHDSYSALVGTKLAVGSALVEAVAGAGAIAAAIADGMAYYAL